MRQAKIKWHEPGHGEMCPGCDLDNIHKMVINRKSHKLPKNLCGKEFCCGYSMRAWRAVNCPDCHQKRKKP